VNERTLVVGGSSPVGRAIERELLGGEHEFMMTSRSGSDGFEPLDVSDAQQGAQLLGRLSPTTVVYLARPNADPGTTDSSIESLRGFALRCVEAGVQRFIFASSAAIYGTSRAQPLREIDAPRPTSLYAERKLQSEHALAEISAKSYMETISIRMFNVYGPGLTQSLINRLALGRASPVAVFDSDEYVRDYIHVADVARGFSAVVSAPTLGSTVINIGSGVGLGNRSLLTLSPASAFRRIPYSDPPSVSIADVSRAHDLLDFEARITVNMSLQDTSSYLC